MKFENRYETRIYEYRHKKNSGRKIKQLFVLSFVSLLILFPTLFIFKMFIESTSGIVSPVGRSIQKIAELVSPKKLDYVVKKELNGTEGIYAVVVKNLKTGETYDFNSTQKFKSASLYKLWVMGESYRQIEDGKLDPDKVLKSTVSDLNRKFDIASESAELTEGEVKGRVRDLINQMIVISNNYAALLLVSEIKLSSVSKFLLKFGFNDSKTGSPPATTAGDIATFYEKLYLGALGNKDSTAEMLAILQKQQLNDRIPKYLPGGINVAHKTGELDGVKHDAGIVFGSKGDYIIVIMSETKNPAVAAEREALLSKAVYEYFESK